MELRSRDDECCNQFIAQNQANKYQLIGTLNKDGVKGDELLAIITVNQATLDEGADLLRKLGVKGYIITVDGGKSTYLFNSQQGNIIVPQLSNLQENPTFRHLPKIMGSEPPPSRGTLY
ncbi:MAG: hypothetical protein V7L11_19560 [Nostoc sp.]|uniref:hypothetical protein n=1 Tax=Nostoc sp. TaxID=1180 RepID=UPI002FFA84BD